MTRALLKRSRYLLIWLGILPLLLAIVAYQISSQHVASVSETLRADAFIRNLDELLATILGAESGQRGYLLTHSQRYILPYRTAQQTIDRDLQDVADFAARNPEYVSIVSRLRQAITAKMAEMQHTIELRDTVGLNAALTEVDTNRGEHAMAQIRQLINQLRSDQITVFERSLAEQKQRQKYLNIVLGVGVALGFLLLYFAYRFSGRYAHERDQIENEIRRLNSTLELRVAERTAELEQRTQELEARSAELQRSNADLTQFAYIASHDLQEPLRMVGSYMGLLARRYGTQLDETAQKYIHFAVEGAQRMQALIHDLLMYSRAGTQPLEKQQICAKDVVEQAIENLGLAIRETSATIDYEDLPKVQADELKLTQVFQNLIGNAIKFNKPSEHPRVRIEANLRGGNWEFAIQDNGVGFDPKYCDRIFEVFQRLHGVGRYAGNGIGLAICRRIVEHHGGRLWAQSTPGVGSTFFFTLPCGRISARNESNPVEVAPGI